jgi:ABC-type bacteriocin/lantibiotic exporter with double-glycine peptidase domain
MGNKFAERLPSFEQMIQYYGPYLSLVLLLIIAILILQFIWFNRVLKAKNQEIKRIADREQKLNDRLLHMIDEETGYRKNIK